MTVLQVPETLGDSPVGRWLLERKSRLSISWKELAGRARVSVDALRRLREDKTIPRVATIRKLIAVCEDDGAQAATAMLAWVVQQNEARTAEIRSGRAGEKAECRVCKRQELNSRVLQARTFRPAAAGKCASFIHPRCRRPITVSPFLGPLEKAKAHFAMSWKELRPIVNKGGLRMDLDRVRTGRTVPRPEGVRKLASILRFSEQETVTLVALAERHWEERSALKRSHALYEKNTRAVCRECERTEFLSKVRSGRMFRPARAGHPATFVHRECREQARKVIQVCPYPGCGTPPRREYKSAAWKKRHQKQRRQRNSYVVPCKRHNLSLQGKRQASRMEKLRFRRFERMFTARYPDGYMSNSRQRNAEELWDAAETGVPPALAIIARRIRKGLFSEAYRNSSWAVFHRFQAAFKNSRYHQHIRAEDLWARARQGDLEALRVRAEVLHPDDEALLRQLKPSDPAALLPLRRRNEFASRKRGVAISKGQVLFRWAGRIRGLVACRLCGLVVHRRRFHPECWATWRKRPEFQAERERRRWSPEKAGRRPIDPPQRPGRPPVKLDEKYGWLMQKAGNVPQRDVARKARVTEQAVSIGIEDFKKRLPGAWDRVFTNHSAESGNRAREEFFPLRTLQVSHQESLIRWLARWGMAPNKISRLVGYPLAEILTVV